jgi:hypothetical protein
MLQKKHGSAAMLSRAIRGSLADKDLLQKKHGSAAMLSGTHLSP